MQLVYSLCLLFLIHGAGCFGQGRYGDALSHNSIETLSSKEGVLYAGIDNPISVDSTIFSHCSDLQLKASNALVVPDTQNIYLLIPQRVGKVRVNLYCLNQNDTVALGYRFFNVLPLPEPRLTLNDWPIDNPAVIDRAVLLNCDSLGVFFSDDLIGSISWMRISDFEVGYNYGGFHFSHHNESNQIGTETFEIFNKLGPNNEISLRVTVASDGRVTKHLPIYRLRVY